MMEFTHVKLSLQQCPDALQGVRVLHLTDMHLAGTPRERSLLRRILAYRYDAIAITGDSCWQLYLANPLNRGHLDPFEPVLSWRGFAREPLADTALMMIEEMLEMTDCQAIYAIRGNHDSADFMNRLEKTRVRVLANETDFLTLNGERVNLLGLNCYGRTPADPIRALQAIEPGRFSIAMSHYPEFAFSLAAGGIDIVLCGHTHGGQICLPGRRPLTSHSQTGRKLSAGLDFIENTAVYTCRGFGFENGRLFCPPEAACVELHQGSTDRTQILHKKL